MNKKSISIPYDLFESPKEIIILIPMSWVDQESITMDIQDYSLHVTAMRTSPIFKDDLIPKKEECYRGPIELIIQLPPNIYFDKIHSKLSTNNILTVLIPKNIIPDQIPIQIESEK